MYEQLGNTRKEKKQQTNITWYNGSINKYWSGEEEFRNLKASQIRTDSIDWFVQKNMSYIADILQAAYNIPRVSCNKGIPNGFPCRIAWSMHEWCRETLEH
jgi:hypothetical protein